MPGRIPSKFPLELHVPLLDPRVLAIARIVDHAYVRGIAFDHGAYGGGEGALCAKPNFCGEVGGRGLCAQCKSGARVGGGGGASVSLLFGGPSWLREGVEY